jgi:hypothetical protein
MDFETKPTADPLQPPPGIIYGTGLRGTIILIHFKYYILIVIWQRLLWILSTFHVKANRIISQQRIKMFTCLRE